MYRAVVIARDRLGVQTHCPQSHILHTRHLPSSNLWITSHPPMANQTLDGLKALAAAFLSNPDYKQAVSKRIIFAKQLYVDHRKASGIKLLIGSINDEKGFVWALIIWNEGVVFYKESGERLIDTAIKYVRLLEPMRTLAGSLRNTHVGDLRSHIMFMFMDQGALDEFLMDQYVSVRGFKHGCKRLANAMHKGRYDITNSGKSWGAADEATDDEGYDSEAEEQEQPRAGMKRRHDNVGKTGILHHSP
jgi:hypothetical protein